jgi:hypothetical protein
LSNKLKVVVAPSAISDNDEEALQKAVWKAVMNALVVKKSFSPSPSKSIQVEVVIETLDTLPLGSQREPLTAAQAELLHNLYKENVITEYHMYDYNESHIVSERFR